MSVPLSEQLHQKHHAEFEAWFNSIHPNNTLTFEWATCHDAAYYCEHMANGAWIAWLALTGKFPLAEQSSSQSIPERIEALAKEAIELECAQRSFTERANRVLLPLADTWIADDNIKALRDLVATFPPCPTRMRLAGKLAHLEGAVRCAAMSAEEYEPK